MTVPTEKGAKVGGEAKGTDKERALVLICAYDVGCAQRGASGGGGDGRQHHAVAAGVESGSKAHDGKERRECDGGGKRSIEADVGRVHDEEVEDGVEGQGADAGEHATTIVAAGVEVAAVGAVQKRRRERYRLLRPREPRCAVTHSAFDCHACYRRQRRRVGDMHAQADGTSRLSEHHHFARAAAESRGVGVRPPQGYALVHQAVVADSTGCAGFHG